MFPMDTRTQAQREADEKIDSFRFPSGTIVPDGVDLRGGTVWIYGSTAIMDISEKHFGMSAAEMSACLSREVDAFFSACEE